KAVLAEALAVVGGHDADESRLRLDASQQREDAAKLAIRGCDAAEILGAQELELARVEGRLAAMEAAQLLSQRVALRDRNAPGKKRVVRPLVVRRVRVHDVDEEEERPTRVAPPEPVGDGGHDLVAANASRPKLAETLQDVQLRDQE